MPSSETIHLLVTQGDPAGIGPEIVARCSREWPRPANCALVILGFPKHFERAGIDSSRFMPKTTKVRTLAPGVHWIAPGESALDQAVDPSTPTCTGGQAAIQCIAHAIDTCMADDADAVCTAPIHKENLRVAGFGHPGHTEFLAERGGGPPVAMMLSGGGLRVVLATIHERIADVPRLITRERLIQLFGLIHRSMPDFGVEFPRIGVAGLNPHAGEGGLFGNEEVEVISPAIRKAQAEGIQITGPHSGDTLFHRQLAGEFDVTVAMYHDQGLIPVKTLAMHEGVNITLGLPFVRTSPDHGTAYDLAGTGRADIGSMSSALTMAYELAARRRKRGCTPGIAAQ